MRATVLRNGPSPVPEPIDSIVEVRGLCKTYGDVEALRGIDLDFPRGKLTSLLGPSGCGKTTLLKIIAGLIEADAGTVAVNGKRVSAPGPERAFVFQDFALMPWATVIRNVAFGLELRGTDKTEREDIARHYIAEVGLAGFREQISSRAFWRHAPACRPGASALGGCRRPASRRTVLGSR